MVKSPTIHASQMNLVWLLIRNSSKIPKTKSLPRYSTYLSELILAKHWLGKTCLQNLVLIDRLRNLA